MVARKVFERSSSLFCMIVMMFCYIVMIGI